MVAVSRYFPDDPKQKESVHAVLREHPELPDFIARVSEKATEMFPEVSIALDTERYDEWDPQLRLLVRITQPWDEFKKTSDEFIHWYARQPGWDLDLIVVMPMWAGPIETYHQ